MKLPLYTPEAKRAQAQPQISDDAGETIAVVYADHADADRIIECVNACEGIADPVAFIAAARDALARVAGVHISDDVDGVPRDGLANMGENLVSNAEVRAARKALAR